jgi:uroporphyrin-III C-methyltransferase
LLGLALAVAVLAAGLSVGGWQRLGQAEQELARRGADTLAEAAAAKALAEQAQAQTKDLQARLGVAEIRLSEVSLQRAQLEELMLSVSRSRDDSLVQDLESALRLAQQQSELTGSVQPLISALQGAEQRIERAAQPRLNPVQRAIARDIERIRAASLVDVPALAARFDELVRNLDELPLRNAMPSEVAPAAMPEPVQAAQGLPPADPNSPATQAVTATLPGATPAEAGAPPPTTETAAAAVSTGTSSAFGQWLAGASNWGQQLAEQWWSLLRAAGSDLVRVSRIDQPEAALLAPEQSYFLRENIKLKLLNARLGLLARQFETARSDVLSARTLVERYFDPAAPTTRLATQTLEQLHADLRQEALPRPDESLAALAVAARGR